MVEIWCSFQTEVLRTIAATIREIALSSVPGKFLHRWRRALVMPGLVDVASGTQCGGLACLATDVAKHLLRQMV